jgi:hypothetical protein
VKDKEIQEDERIKLEVVGNIYRMTINDTKKPDEALYTARAINPAGQVSCNGRVKIQRKYEMYDNVLLCLSIKTTGKSRGTVMCYDFVCF